jgi:hypothetical protein
MSGKFDYVEWDENSQLICDDLKGRVEELDAMILTMLGHSRERFLAVTKLEECFMWLGKAIRSDQLKRMSKDV